MTTTPDPSHQLSRETICIIGAGISGLVAAKVFRARGHQVVIFEKSGDLGGVWEPARSYPGVKTQTPRDLYCFSDHPMPQDYPEWPSGAQVYAYLDSYAAKFGLRPVIRFDTAIQNVSRAADRQGYDVTNADGTTATTRFSHVIVATGQFSRPNKLDLAGQSAFEAAGGLVRHSSEHVDASVVKARDVAVIGFSKSATDVAMNALDEGATSVSIVYREPTWKIPYFFGGLINFKNILYCRASEAMFTPWKPSPFGRLMRALSAPAIWANWRALESLLNMQFGLKKLGLRPSGKIEDSIHCATSIETPGFYKAIKDGRIRPIQGSPAGLRPGHVIVGNQAVRADVVIEATGWRQELPFLDETIRGKLVGPDGQYRLYRLMVNPDLPGLGFVGFNSSFITTLSAELGAHWLARYIEGNLKHMPTDAQMRQALQSVAAWKATKRQIATTFGGLCVAPYHHFHFDQLMTDIGARRKGGNPLAANLAPISPKAYAKLLETAPQTGMMRAAG